jgi:sulfate adenylyltransferase subunit 1 (EFTu-like GTPase family)
MVSTDSNWLQQKTDTHKVDSKGSSRAVGIRLRLRNTVPTTLHISYYISNLKTENDKPTQQKKIKSNEVENVSLVVSAKLCFKVYGENTHGYF